MKRFCLCFALTLVLQVWTFVPAQDAAVEKEITAGNFSAAKALINEKMVDPATPPKEAWELLMRREILDRIKSDFSASEEQVIEYIKRYYPDVTPEQIARWKAEKSLEVMTIDGQERYFEKAGPNLFRIDKEAIARKREVDGTGRGSGGCLPEHLPKILAAAEASDRPDRLEPKRMLVTYTLTVPANAVPEGETLRCWLPYPREDHRRQGNVEFVDSNLENPIIAPHEYKHRSIYSEKIAVKDTPTVFQIKFRYTAYGEYFDLDKFDIKPYDKNSALYKEYTAEREQHVIFTDEIKQLSEQFVGDEKDPVEIVRKIFKGITSNYPWASAREYSTVDNIPVYVINENHGDCGMVGLLMVTMCRYHGIPAKWQSGFMMHPGEKNLHDWAEVYFEGVGWVPIDPSFGRRKFPDQPELDMFFCSGIDSYRWIVNEDYGMAFYPAKIYPRSETVDFQRGEVEWRGGNLYFNQWRWGFEIEYCDGEKK